MMIEGSGSIPLTSGSGSGRAKSMWIRWIRNTGCSPNLHVLQDARALRALAPVGNEHNDDYDDEEGDAHAHGNDDRLGESGVELVVVQLADVEAQPLADHDNDVGQLVGVLAAYNHPKVRKLKLEFFPRSF
jgi:hypothetical protein